MAKFIILITLCFLFVTIRADIDVNQKFDEVFILDKNKFNEEIASKKRFLDYMENKIGQIKDTLDEIKSTINEGLENPITQYVIDTIKEGIEDEIKDLIGRSQPRPGLTTGTTISNHHHDIEDATTTGSELKIETEDTEIEGTETSNTEILESQGNLLTHSTLLLVSIMFTLMKYLE